jgi:periplasmic copper chaperone A
MCEAVASVPAGGQRAVAISTGRLLLALLALAVSTPLRAQESGPAIVVREPWSRATPAGSKVGVGYVVIENRGPASQQLVAARSEIAGKTELHETVESAGIARMSPIGDLVVPPGGRAAFEPSGRHIMFMDLKRPLRQGERFQATLFFEPGGPVQAEFEVRSMGAAAPHAH